MRGDVVIVDLAFTDVSGSQRRPAVVIQSDVYNAMVRKTMVALITGNLARDGDGAHVFVDPSTPDGATSGLKGPSLVSCLNISTVEQSAILRVIGSLSDQTMSEVDDCLRAALDLP